jgi:hypothetical protein
VALRPAAQQVEFAPRAAAKVASLCRLAEQVAATRRDGPDRQGHRAGAAVRESPARPKAAAVCPVGPRVAVMRAAYLAPPEAVRRVAVAHSAAVPAVQRDVVERPVAAVVVAVGSQAVPRVVAVVSPDEPPGVAAAEPDVQRAVLAVRDGRPAVVQVAAAVQVLPPEVAAVAQPVWPLVAAEEPPFSARLRRPFSSVLRFAPVSAQAARPARTTGLFPSHQFGWQRPAHQTLQPKPA